jgi:hypothetical protein
MSSELAASMTCTWPDVSMTSRCVTLGDGTDVQLERHQKEVVAVDQGKFCEDEPGEISLRRLDAAKIGKRSIGGTCPRPSASAMLPRAVALPLQDVQTFTAQLGAHAVQ